MLKIDFQETLVPMPPAISEVVVYIVDDDDSVRDSLARLLRSAGLHPRPYASAERFLEEVRDIKGACILLDISMSQMSGMQVQERLNAMNVRLPVITISAQDDERTRERAQMLGARMFLRKPVDDQALLDAIHWVTMARKYNRTT